MKTLYVASSLFFLIFGMVLSFIGLEGWDTCIILGWIFRVLAKLEEE